MNKTDQTTEKYVAYYRVSTKRQSLGLDAQRSAVLAKIPAADIIAEYSEKESGAHDDRPQLARAMAEARRHGATLVVAKADRLSRDLTYAAMAVFRSGVRVICLDMPTEAAADPLLFGVYFGLAQKEREMISQRTKSALAALKAKGVKLGSPTKLTFTEEERKKGQEVRSRRADLNPNNVRSADEIRRYLAAGNKRNLSAIARHLDARGCYTSRGVRHDAKSVKLLMARYGI